MVVLSWTAIRVITRLQHTMMDGIQETCLKNAAEEGCELRVAVSRIVGRTNKWDYTDVTI